MRTFDFPAPVDMADAMSAARAALDDEGLVVRSGYGLRRPWIVRVDDPAHGPIDRLCLPRERIGVK